MKVHAPGSAHLNPSARPSIDTSGNFPVHVSAESPSNISPNPSEVISEVSEDKISASAEGGPRSQVCARKTHCLLEKISGTHICRVDFTKFLDFPFKIGLFRGSGCPPNIFFIGIAIFVLLAHTNFCNPMISLSGIYLKLAHFWSK